MVSRYVCNFDFQSLHLERTSIVAFEPIVGFKEFWNSIESYQRGDIGEPNGISGWGTIFLLVDR